VRLPGARWKVYVEGAGAAAAPPPWSGRAGETSLMTVAGMVGPPPRQTGVHRSEHNSLAGPVRSCKRALPLGMQLTTFSTACI
jgi:hypothetical protein